MARPSPNLVERLQQELALTRREVARLRELNRELEAMFEASHDEIFLADRDGVILRVNQACQRLHNVSVAELVGKSVLEFERQGLLFPSAVPGVLRDRKPMTIIQRTRAGRHLIVTASPVLGEDGGLIGVVGSSKDVTEIFQMKQQLEEAWEQVSRYRSELKELRVELMRDPDIVAVSPRTQKVFDLARKVALVDTTVLILGRHLADRAGVVRRSPGR